MSATGNEVLRVRCGRAWLGWPASKVREIVSFQALTPLPRAPSHIGGLVALDGRVVTVLDLVPLLEMDSDPEPATRLVVVDLGGETVAVLAQEVSGVLQVVASDMGRALHGNPVLDSVTHQVGKAHERLIWCLDVAALDRIARERT